MKANRSSIKAATALSLLIVLSACGADEPATTNVPITVGPPAATAGPVQTPTVAPPTSPDAKAPQDPLEGFEFKPFTGEAADKFGAENVMVAYKHFIKFQINNGWPQPLVNKKASEIRDIEFSFMEQYMTPKAYESWKKSVTERSTNEAAAGAINALTVYGVNNDTFTVKTDPLTVNTKFGGATTRLDKTSTGNRLEMKFTISTEIRGTNEGDAVRLPLERTLTVWAIPNGEEDTPWLIDAWSGQVKAADAYLPDAPK